MSVNDRNLFAIRLRQLRKEYEQTMLSLGGMVGVSEQAISQYERGLRLPNHEILTRLSDALGVDIQYLNGSSDKRQLNIVKRELEELISSLKYLSKNSNSGVNPYIYPSLKLLSYMFYPPSNEQPLTLAQSILFEKYLELFYEYAFKTQYDINKPKFLEDDTILGHFNELISMINSYDSNTNG